MSLGRRRKEEPQPELPQPPDAPRRLRFRWGQLVGLALVLAAPALSIAGLLEEAQRTSSVVSADQGVQVRVQHPTRMRYRTNQWLTVEVQNRGPTAHEEILVQVDRAYVQSFNTLAVVPEPRQAFEFALADVPAGATRRVALQLQAQHYGRRQGAVRVQPRRGAAVEVPIRTLVLW